MNGWVGKLNPPEADKLELNIGNSDLGFHIRVKYEPLGVKSVPGPGDPGIYFPVIRTINRS